MTLAITLVALGLLLCGVTVSGCREKSAPNKTDPSSLIVLNAPADGTVRRVLVGEGVAVREGAPVVEIAVDAPPPFSAGETDAQREREARAVAARNAAQGLQREVERASVEVQRMESLVAQNAAPPAQLDAARAVYQQAQEHLQESRAGGANSPVASLIRPGAPSAINRNTARGEATAFVRASVEGEVRVVSVRPGQRVAAGQPVVTLAPKSR